jgi:hypothetical protein
LGHPVPGGYEYRNLALQVGGVLYDSVKYGLKKTVKCGHEFCGTRTGK